MKGMTRFLHYCGRSSGSTYFDLSVIVREVLSRNGFLRCGVRLVRVHNTCLAKQRTESTVRFVAACMVMESAHRLRKAAGARVARKAPTVRQPSPRSPTHTTAPRANQWRGSVRPSSVHSTSPPSALRRPCSRRPQLTWAGRFGGTLRSPASPTSSPAGTSVGDAGTRCGDADEPGADGAKEGGEGDSVVCGGVGASAGGGGDGAGGGSGAMATATGRRNEMHTMILLGATSRTSCSVTSAQRRKRRPPSGGLVEVGGGTHDHARSIRCRRDEQRGYGLVLIC